jgi:glycosyltransferase involved in cell wall biosynthesis
MSSPGPSVELVVPVYNEEHDLEQNVRALANQVTRIPEFRWSIVIADNGSTDRTPLIAQNVAQECHLIRVVRISEKGRGRALRQVWAASRADIVAYTDVDLSTDLHHLRELVSCLGEGFDVSMGSRRMAESVVTRSFLRNLLSHGYNSLLRCVLGVHFKDAQCGFKAATTSFVREVVPRVKATGWFFDTEILVLAEKNNYRIREIPVRWMEDPRSSVRILPAICEQLRGICRLRVSQLRFR